MTRTAPRGRAQLARHQVEIGRLARAVGADDRGELARPERAGDAVDGDMAAEADRQVARFERGHGGAGRLPLQAGAGQPHALVADRDIHVLDLDFLDELRDRPGDVGIDLDLEMIHRLQRLMVLLAEDHLALGRVELHALHRRDELFRVGRAAAFSTAVTSAIAAEKPPAVKKSGGALKRF